MWQRLTKKLTIHEPRGKPFMGTSVDALDEFEQRYEFAFPRSYRAFATEVGAGLFCGYFRIFTPDFGLDDEVEMRGLPLFREIYGNPDFIDQMMPFGGTIAGDAIVWDPREVTAVRAKEYGIYVLPRDMRRIIRLCSDFKTFVNDFCFGQEFMIALSGAPDPEWEIMYTMERFRPSRRTNRYQAPAPRRLR